MSGKGQPKETAWGNLRASGVFAEVLIARTTYADVVDSLFFKDKNTLTIDLGDLQSEQEKLADFLRDHFKVDSSASRKGLKLDASAVSPKELEHMVNKFVSRQNLSSTYWATLDKNTVKIKRFDRTKKPKENKHPVMPAKITHGW